MQETTGTQAADVTKMARATLTPMSGLLFGSVEMAGGASVMVVAAA